MATEVERELAQLLIMLADQVATMSPLPPSMKYGRIEEIKKRCQEIIGEGSHR